MKRLVGLTVALMVGLAACEDFAGPTESGLQPPTGTPPSASELNLRMVSGDSQVGIVRDTLLDPLVVEVTDGEGVIVEDASVNWAVGSSDGGSVRFDATTTDDQGLTQNRWRVGDVPGGTEEVVAWVASADADPDTVSFTAELTGVPDTIEIVQGGIETDNEFSEPEIVVGDTVFVGHEHWSRKAFKGIVRDADGRRVRGATLTWTVTSGLGGVGDEPEGGGSETVMVNTAADGSVTVWRRGCSPNALLCPGEESWVGATLSLEKYPDVVPITLHALIRN